MPRRLILSKSRLLAILRSSAVDPRVPGPDAVVADIVSQNPRYGEDRAIELIRESQANKDTDGLIRAIGLLAMTVAVREGA